MVVSYKATETTKWVLMADPFLSKCKVLSNCHWDHKLNIFEKLSMNYEWVFLNR